MAARRRCASTVARKWQAADGIAGFELRPVKGLLPTFQPGAHIDVHMPNGEIRQYSITNGPGETDSYVIGVKLRTGFEGRLEMHARNGARGRRARDLRAAQQFPAAPRRDQDPVRRRRHRHHAAAGHGAGAATIRTCRTNCTISRRASEHLAFPDRLQSLGGYARRRISASPRTQTGTKLRELLVVLPRPACMSISAALARCWRPRGKSRPSRAGPKTAVHFEYFKNTNEHRRQFELRGGARALLRDAPGAGRQDDPGGHARERHRHRRPPASRGPAAPAWRR